jgi:hypothetical protein
MTPKRAAAYLGGASLLAAWLASAAGVVFDAPPVVQEDARPVQTAGTETLAADVQTQAARLRDRLAAAPTPQEPFRNLFRFGARPEAQRPRRAAAPVAEPAPPPQMLPDIPLTLIGIAEDASPQGPVRTALITTARGELLTVKAGQDVEIRYRVRTVGTDAVELTDTANGTVRLLTLK